MENASQALIIAGAVLIAIIILSVGVMLKNNLSKSSEAYIENLDNLQIQKYNSNFTIYADEGKIITAQDIVTVIGAAKKSGWGTEIYVKLTGERGYADYTKDSSMYDENVFLSTHILYTDEYGNPHNQFKFDSTATSNGGIEYDKYGRVSAIYFQQIN